MKNDKKNNVTIWIICAVILVVLIAVITVLIVNGTSANKSNATNTEENINSNTDKSNEPVIDEPTSKVTEQEMIDKYGVSIKDAEEIVLTNFNSDNYECKTTISDDEYYMITVIDTFDKTKYKFKVDPVTKTAFLLED